MRAIMSSNKSLILVVEDETAVRDSILAHLADSDFQTLSAATGTQGLEMFTQHRPALVLLDLRLPGMDGLELLKAIRKHSPDAAVIVISGKGLMDDAVAALRWGAWDYLTKP